MALRARFTINGITHETPQGRHESEAAFRERVANEVTFCSRRALLKDGVLSVSASFEKIREIQSPAYPITKVTRETLRFGGVEIVTTSVCAKCERMRKDGQRCPDCED